MPNTRSSSSKATLARAFSWSAALKAAGILLGFASTTLLARLLPVDEFGLYSLVIAIATLLVVPAAMGVPELLIREASRSIAEGNAGRLRALISWAAWSVLATTAIVVAGLVLWRICSGETAITFSLMVILSVLVPLMAMNSTRSALLVGLRATTRGQVADNLVKPITLIVALLAMAGVQSHIDAETALMVTAVAVFAAFLYGAVALSRVLAPLSVPQARGTRDATFGKWTTSALPLAALSGMYLISQQADLVMLGWLSTSEEVGVYRVVSQMGLLVVVGQQFVRLVAAPRFAAYWKSNRTRDLQQLATLTSRISFAIGGLCAVVFFIWGDVILRSVFGERYAAGYTALIILCCAQLINAGFGSTGNLLNMCGFEKSAIWGLALGVLVNVVAAYVMIPSFGASGAATATFMGIITWNIVLWRMVRVRIGIRPTAFGV